ncbi:S1C family serine protease [Solirubrobacter ginsenosidimutans]|uniref:S1C family serine protease n=2 Tax=Solirubrobacter ginsenosidimutans TaxID=490573 RepID=A0A9X3MQ88_9ACTN|nr:PDZ domain-containing protein [Solirubrobacter ginsenosidimutans]MDA0159877.1 S1C family serine protease [Solirubrobacter ginsenosidimutans]
MPTLAAADPQLGGGAAPGIGFAISSNSVRNVVRQLVSTGQVTHSDRAAIGTDLRTDPEGGARVVAVSAGGPAARAGIRAGDLLVTIDAKATPTVDDVAGVLATMRPGRRVFVGLVTDSGARRSVTIELGEIKSS